MVEFLLTPKLYRLPLTPNYCSHVLLWRRLIVPVIEMSALFDSSTFPQHSSALTVLRYQKASHAPLEYFGIVVKNPPLKIMVNDQQACEGPASDHGIWQSSELVLAHFLHDELPIPILSLPYLTSEAFRDFVATTHPGHDSQ